jgi:hypothetical protein
LALSLDQEASEATKGGVTVPFGTFKKVHRCAVISLESRAAQHSHDDFAKAAKELLEKIDQTTSVFHRERSGYVAGSLR